MSNPEQIDSAGDPMAAMQAEDTLTMKKITLLWTQAQPVVSAYINSTIHDHVMAEDLLQQVAVTVVEKFDQFDEERSFTAWTLGMARFEILRYLRKNHNDRHVFAGEALTEIAGAFERIEPEMDEMHHALGQCLKNIKGRSRQVLVLRYGEGYKPAKIAEVLGIDPNNISVMLHRARNFLRSCIEQRVGAESQS